MAIFELLVGLAVGTLVGNTVGIDYYRRRLRKAARQVPADQIVLATLERAVAEDTRRRRV